MPSVEERLRELAVAARGNPREAHAVLRSLLESDQRSIRESALRIGAATFTDDGLVGLLREDVDDVLRNAGLEMIVQRGARIVPLLAELLEDRDDDVVLQAVLALDRIRDPRAADAMRHVLPHPNLNVAQAAVTALGHLGSQSAVMDLLPFLHAEDWLRAAAVEALGDLRSTAALEALSALLPDPEIGAFAAEAIARIGGATAFGALAHRWLELTGTGESILALMAHVAEGAHEPIEAPGELLRALAVTVRHHESRPRLDAARCLLVLGSPGGDEALEVLLTSDWRGDALPACLRRRPDLVETLVMHPACARARIWGLRLLAQHPSAVPLHVIERVVATHRVSDDLNALAEILVRLAEPRLARAVVEIYATASFDQRRKWIPVIAAYRPYLREALTRIEELPPSARTVLEAVVAEPVGSVAMLLGMDDPVRLEALEHFAHQTDVLDALPWAEWLARSPGQYAPVAARLAGQAGLRLARPEIRALLAQEPHPDLLRLVAELRDEDSVPALVHLIDAGDPLRAPYAVVALGSIGGAQAREALRTLIAHDSCWVRFAYRALAECRAVEDLPLFRGGLSHDDWHVRLMCVTVLGVARQAEDLTLLSAAAADPVAAVADRARRYLAR